MTQVNCEKIARTRKFISKNLAQTPSESDRFFEDRNRNHIGNNYENYFIRDEFRHDCDRIIYSKAFRRMQHKAQVFSNKKGDHYRTRLTHTLEVAQIARSISRNLGLNETLSEAIALGHDIGHTPFGHAGERALDRIMRGEDNLDGVLKFSIDYGGFKHNINSVKILEVVEKRKDTRGLNLTWQTLDGILKHTEIYKENKTWDISRFVRDISNYELIISTNTPLTLEGQATALADEIAQMEHDLDDSLRDREMFEFKALLKEIKIILNKVKPYGNDLFDEFYIKINELGKIKTHTQWSEVINIIISYLIADICENSMKNIDELNNINDIILMGENNRKYITKHVISYSPTGKLFSSEMKELMVTKIILSSKVNKFDRHGQDIIRKLFKTYYENPKLIAKKQLMILSRNIEKITKTYPHFEKELEYLNIDLSHNLDLKVLEVIKLNFNLGSFSSNTGIEYNYLKSLLKELNLKDDAKIHKSIEEILNYINKNRADDIEVEDPEGKLNFIKALCELHYSYISIICEYISEMSDDYAVKEYDNLK